jgi:hypothetical protein
MKCYANKRNLDIQKVAETMTKAKKAVNSGRIEPFSSLLSPLIKESLIETGKDKYRKGTLLLPVFVVWLVLAITMRRDLNYNQVIEWMISSYRWATMILPAVLLSHQL